ncbi:MAG: S9 family peptidase [Bacteroidota bacterium]
MKKIVLLIVAFSTICVFAQKNKGGSLAVQLKQGSAKGKVTPEFLWSLGRVSDVQVSPDGTQIVFGITYYDVAENKGNRDLYLLSVNGGEVKRLTETLNSEFNAIWRPDGKKIGYISSEKGSPQIWEMNPDGSDKIQISNITNGVNGFSYAPSMKHLLYTSDVKLDSDVQDVYPDLPKANALIYTELMYRHWDSWSDQSYSHIFVSAYPIPKEEQGKDIMPKERWDAPIATSGGMEQIAWNNAGTKIAYACKKLAGKEYAISTNSDIYLYDITSGKTNNISAPNPGYDMDPVFSTDGKMIAWNSMKTAGFESDKKRIMIYNFAASKVEDYSASFDQSSTNFVWSSDNKMLYFISGIHATYQLFQLDIAKKKITQITKGAHDYTELQLAGNKLVGAKMSMSMPTEIYTVDIAKGLETQISFVNKDKLAKVTMGRVEERWIGSTDGSKLLTWVIYPPDFDSKKKYPTLLYTEGGPQSAISQFFSYRWNFQIMAANGYIIVAPNRHGLPTFGQEWNDQISLDYGGQNQLDCLAAIDSMCKEPFVNKEKLGAVGASYGAFSVYWLAGNHNKRFKAFIAHCGMFNLESWYGTTEEMFFANHDIGGAYYNKIRPKSYDFSPHRFVGNWDTPILVIHGGNDFRIPYTEGMQAFNAAQMKDIPSKFLFFPEESHFVLKPQNSILWQREFFKWFDSYLK